MTKLQRSNLLPQRYEDDLFVCDVIDAVPKGDMAAMEHPLFSLSTKSDMKAHKLAAGWEIRVLKNEWRDWVATKQIKVRNADSSYISFCEKLGPYQQEQLF